jgi:hypothetical protein
MLNHPNLLQMQQSLQLMMLQVEHELDSVLQCSMFVMMSQRYQQHWIVEFQSEIHLQRKPNFQVMLLQDTIELD